MTNSGSGKIRLTIHIVKQDWLERAVEINRFHLQQLKDDSSWTVAKTAVALNRSIGSVSQDILIAKWCKTHEKQLKRCSSMKDALAYIKVKEKEQLFSGLD